VFDDTWTRSVSADDEATTHDVSLTSNDGAGAPAGWVTITVADTTSGPVVENVTTPDRSAPVFSDTVSITDSSPAPEAGDTVNHGSELDAVHDVEAVTATKVSADASEGTCQVDGSTVMLGRIDIPD